MRTYDDIIELLLGADTKKRTAWSHQLTVAEAKYTVKNIRRGKDGWNPEADKYLS